MKVQRGRAQGTHPPFNCKDTSFSRNCNKKLKIICPICLIPTINHYRATMIDIDTIDPKIVLIVTLDIFTQRFIFFRCCIIFYPDVNQTPHRKNTILSIFGITLIRYPLQPVTLICRAELFDEIISLLV